MSGIEAVEPDNCAYFITVDQGLEEKAVEISKLDFHRYKEAKLVLRHALDFEEKYELMLGNYIAFEKKVTGCAIEEMAQANWLFDEFHYIESFVENLDIGRTIINFMTTTRMYLDQVGRDVKKCIGDEERADMLFKQFTSDLYDKHFEYRFMHALRNHTQHYAQPISEVSLGSRSKKNEDGKFFWLYSSDIFIGKKYLEVNTKFPKGVLEEIKEKVNVGEALRVYMACLSCIHARLRLEISGHVDNARAVIEEAIHRLGVEVSKTQPAYLSHVIYGESELDIVSSDDTQLVLIYDDIRIRLRDKNADIYSLPRRGVSNRNGKVSG